MISRFQSLQLVNSGHRNGPSHPMFLYLNVIQYVSQVPYRLHAVLVHEGQANAGHYWAYIYDPRQHCWMKYNDITVTMSSWEELVRDSFGGYRNASAYCLMYIDDKKPFLIEGTFSLWCGKMNTLEEGNRGAHMFHDKNNMYGTSVMDKYNTNCFTK